MRVTVQEDVKTLLTVLTAFILCFGQSARAEVPTEKAGQRTVTSTIRVRIPSFASITLSENKSSVIPAREAAAFKSVKGSADDSGLQANTSWITSMARINGDVSSAVSNPKSGSQQAPVISLVYTSTPQ